MSDLKFFSSVVEGSKVNFPKFTGERVYMEKFFKNEGLPKHLSRWQPTVDSMLDGINTDNPIFIMIDQGIVQANKSHRRAGRHIDGYWIEDVHAHSGTHSASVCGYSGAHNSSRTNNDWKHATLDVPESIILASSYPSSRGWIGEWQGEIGEGGDCTNIDVSNMNEITLKSNRAYIGNVGFIHESLSVDRDIQRTLVRLNLKGY